MAISVSVNCPSISAYPVGYLLRIQRGIIEQRCDDGLLCGRVGHAGHWTTSPTREVGEKSSVRASIGPEGVPSPTVFTATTSIQTYSRGPNPVRVQPVSGARTTQSSITRVLAWVEVVDECEALGELEALGECEVLNVGFAV